jgi:hypothetical protein
MRFITSSLSSSVAQPVTEPLFQCVAVRLYDGVKGPRNSRRSGIARPPRLVDQTLPKKGRACPESRPVKRHYRQSRMKYIVLTAVEKTRGSRRHRLGSGWNSGAGSGCGRDPASPCRGRDSRRIRSDRVGSVSCRHSGLAISSSAEDDPRAVCTSWTSQFGSTRLVQQIRPWDTNRSNK